jgi:hypothetical protein
MEHHTNYSRSEIGVVSHQAVCSLLMSSLVNPRAIGDLHLDSGCLMTMLPDASPLINLQDNKTSVHLANQSTVDAIKTGTFSLPLSVKTDVKALVVLLLHEPLLWVANLCDKGLNFVFTKNGCKIYPSADQQPSLKPVGKGYWRGNLYYLPLELVSSKSSTLVSPTPVDNSLLVYHIVSLILDSGRSSSSSSSTRSHHRFSMRLMSNNVQRASRASYPARFSSPVKLIAARNLAS